MNLQAIARRTWSQDSQPIPHSVKIIAVDAEGNPTLALASHYPGTSIATPDEAYRI